MRLSSIHWPLSKRPRKKHRWCGKPGRGSRKSHRRHPWKRNRQSDPTAGHAGRRVFRSRALHGVGHGGGDGRQWRCRPTIRPYLKYTGFEFWNRVPVGIRFPSASLRTKSQSLQLMVSAKGGCAGARIHSPGSRVRIWSAVGKLAILARFVYALGAWNGPIGSLETLRLKRNSCSGTTREQPSMVPPLKSLSALLGTYLVMGAGAVAADDRPSGD